MKRKRVFCIFISLLMGASICMSSTGMVFAAEADTSAEADATEKASEENIIDLTAFCTDGEYRYKGIPWRASKEETEEALGVSLELDIGKGTEMGNYRSPIEFQGESGYVTVGFLKDGVTFVDFSFGAEEEDAEEYEGDLTGLWEYVREQFTEQYGEPDKVTEKEIVKSCQWQEKKDGDVNTILNLQCCYDNAGGRMYNMSFGAVGFKDLKELRKELGISPEDLEAEITETEEAE